jgi:hypothetical protein
MIPTWDKELRALRDPDAFQRLAVQLPQVGTWLESTDPVPPVLPMGTLRNTLRRIVDDDAPVVTGLVPIGDALCHTNPTFAFGASLSLSHAVHLADIAERAADHRELVCTFDDAVGADAAERFGAVSAEDADRLRLWSGQPIDVTRRDETMPMFLRFVAYRVAMNDPELLRAVVRHIDALDPVDALADNDALLDRADVLFRDAVQPQPGIPQRARLLEALSG